MKDISLTSFVNFVIKAHGTARITFIRKAKKQYEKYERKIDFYRTLREEIERMHKSNGSRDSLDSLVPAVSDEKKVALYSKCVKEYKKWMGRKNFEWIGVRDQVFTISGLPIKVNPELGLKINGVGYLVKLHFLKDEPSRVRTDSILYLMSKMDICRERNLVPAILDVQRGKLLTQLSFSQDIEVLLLGEASMFLTLWNSI